MHTVACQLPTEVVCAAFGSKRSHEVVACGGADCSVHVFPFGSGSRLAKLDGHTTKVTAVAFDPDQRRVVAGSDGGSIRLWDLETEQGIRTFGTGHRTTVTAVDYHSFGEFIATVSEDTHLRVWDVRKKSCLQSYKGVPNGLRAVQFNPNGKWVASGCSQGVVRIYDLTNGELLKELVTHQGPISSIKFHPEHLFLAAGSHDGSMSLWELDTFQRSFRSEPIVGRPVHQVQFTTEADTELLVASEKQLRVYPFSRMSDRSASQLDAPWNVCSGLVYSANAREALAVECRGTAIHYTRMPLGAKPNKPAAPQPPPQSGGVPTKAPEYNKPQLSPTPQQQQPAAVSPNARAPPQQPQQQQQFYMNDAKAQQLLQRVQTPPDKRAAIPMIPMTTNNPPPPSQQQPFSGRSGLDGVPAASSSSAMDVVEQLSNASASMVSLLQRRLTHLRVVRSTWPTDPRNALRHLVSIAKSETDCGVVTDFLNAMQNQRMKERVSFELLPEFMTLVVAALQHKQDPVLVAALRIARSMNTKFRAKIDETLRGAQFIGNGVDLAMEARIDKCREVQNYFEDVIGVASTQAINKDAVGEEARLCLNEIPSLRRR